MKLGGSILSDIDDQLEFGDVIVINNNINSEQSRLRKFFGTPITCKTPFEFSKNENGQSSLKINSTHSGHYTTVISNEIMQNVNDDICEKVDCIDVDGHITISTDDIGKNIAKKIIGGQLNITSGVISDVELSTTSCTTSKMVPMMYINFDEGCDRCIHNTTFEIDSTRCTGWIVFRNDIPKFDNVRSKTIKRLCIADQLLDKASKVIENEFWSKLFEFGYKVEYTFEGVTNTKKILGMKSFSRIAKDRNFKSLEFSEFPYRLKKGVKLNDILDVSQFENLYSIDIECKNVGVYIYKKEFEPYKVKTLMNDIIKPNYNYCETIERNLPCTEDGWSVILYRI